MSLKRFSSYNIRKIGLLGLLLISLIFLSLSSNQVLGVTVSNIPKTIVNSAGVGTIAWLNPQQANVSDNSYATAAVSGTTQSNYLNASNFQFSIPVGSTINGIEVRIERSGSSNNRARDAILRLTKNGVISGNNYAYTVTRWLTADAVITYGGPADLWGLNWTALDINNVNFGLVFSVDASNTVTARVDYINVTVNYTAQAANLILFVTPTPANNSVSYDNSVYVNITTNFAATICQLNWSGTLYDMSGSGIQWYYNVPSLSIGNYYYSVRCNDTLGWTNTSIRNITIATFPTISYVPPTDPNAWSTQNTWTYVNTSVSGSNIGSALIDWNYTLVLWLRLNNESGESTTFFKDSSTYGNNATCTGTACPIYNQGILGSALSFDRVNDEINITNSNSLNPSNEITISAWFKINGSTGTNRYIISKPAGATWVAPLATYAIRLNASNNLQFWINNGSNPANIVTSTSTYTADNTWRHVAATFNGTVQRLYVNGQLVGSNTLVTSISSSTQVLYIGTTGRTTTERWNGSLDDIQLFSRALSDVEVNASYDASTYKLYRNFTNLSLGDYFYTAYIQDVFGGINSTENRLFTVTSAPPDNTAPNVSQVSPSDPTYTQDPSQLFTCNITDNDEVYNITLYVWNSTGGLVSDGDNWCYQESANTSTQCGGLNNGTYNPVGNWVTPANAYDGSWITSTTGGSAFSNYIYVTYFKPIDALNTSVWQVKDSISTRNLTILAACWNQPNLSLRIAGSSSGGYIRWECFDGGAWQIISTDSTSNIAYEEGMYWNINLSTKYVSGQYNISSWIFNFPYTDTFYWNCLGYDVSNNKAFAPTNYTIAKLPAKAAPIILSINITDYQIPDDQIILFAGGIRNVSCLVTAMDLNGVSNITNASATFYYYLNNSYDPDNNNTHYTNSNCTLNETTSENKTFACLFQIYYFANNGTWNCSAIVYDTDNLSGTDIVSTTINPLYAVNLTDGISFGNVPTSTESSEIIANITNMGNMPINISLQGYAMFIGDNTGMNCSDSTNITINNIKFSSSSGQTFSQKNSLNGAIQLLNITLQKPTSTTPIINNTYWQIMPDPGANNRQCTGFIIFSAEAS